MNSNKEKEEKRGFRASDFVLVVLAILGIMNTLMIDRAKIPDWYFYSSIGLIVVATAVFFVSHFGRSWDDKINAWREERKRNAIAQRHFGEFKDIVRNCRRFNLLIFSVLDRLRGQFEQPEIKEKMGLLPIYLIQTYNRNDVENLLNTLIYRLEGFDGITLRELTLSAEQFDMVLRIYKQNIALVSIFAREIKKEHKIPDHIEKEYEASREKYNDFMKDCTRYFHKLNQELGEIIVSEHFDYAKKW